MTTDGGGPTSDRADRHGWVIGVSASWRPVLMWVGVALAGLVSLTEVDRLVADASLSGGRSWSVGQVVGPAAFASRGAWDAWTVADPIVAGLVRLHTLCDAVFVLGYAVLLWGLVTSLTTSPLVPLPDTGRWRRVRRVLFLPKTGCWLRRVVVALVVLEVVEAVLLLVGAAVLPDGVPAGLRFGVALVAVLKWLTVLLFVVLWVAAPGPRHELAVRLRLVATAVKFQRLGALALGLLALLSLVPARDLFDQLPDVQRRWLDDGQGVGHLFFAVVGTVLFTAVTFVVGRMRAERANAYYTGVEPLDDQKAVRRWWVVVPVVVALGAGLLAWLGPDDVVDVRNLAIFVVPPLVLVLLSSFPAVANRAPKVPVNEIEPPAVGTERDTAVAVAVAGDVLAFAALTVGGVGLVRSFTAQLVLEPRLFWAWIVLVGAVVTVVVAPWVVPRLVACGVRGTRLEHVLTPDEEACDQDSALRRGAVVVGLALVVVLFGGFALFPAQVTRVVGVTATAGTLLTAWVLLLGIAQIATQYAQPLAIFRALGLKATPVISLLVLIGVVNGLAGGDVDLHRVAGFDPPATPTGASVATTIGRQTLAGRFTAWLEDGRGCATVMRTSSGPASVRPLLLVAARGGGIRAAYWTAQGLAAFGRPGTCADRAVLLSSGVSGGSVGLATAHVIGLTPDPVELPTAADDLTSPDGLAAATAGLFDADVLGNLTGVRLPSAGVPEHPGWAWRDRARLMEETWDGQVGGLQQRMEGLARGRAGALVLNSTDAPSGCRILVSQLDVGGAPSVGGTLPCGPGGQVAAGTDYVDSGTCPRALSWSTAAMLSARFPFVTPAGRTTSCVTDEDGLQLVDGGYAEASGLGTLSDLAPTIMDLVHEENARVVSGGRGAYVVPIVVDLNNGFGSDVDPAAPEPALEPLVPAVGVFNGSRQGADPASWGSRLMTQLADPCPAATGPCAAAVAQARAATGTVASLAPVTEPAVTAPLGWTLSDASRRNLVANLRCGELATADTCTHLRGVQALVDRSPAPR